MMEMGIDLEEKKLVVFCPSTVNITQLFREVEKRVPTSFKLISKYDKEIPKLEYKKIIHALAWMLSVDKSADDLKVAELRGDLDEAFTYLVRRRIHFISGLSEDEDLIYVHGWEGESEEHFKLKLVAYKTLKSDYLYKDEEIQVEQEAVHIDEHIYRRDEGGNFFLHLVPDLQTTDRKIWVEIETLRGIKDPLIGLIQKYQRKRSAVEQFEEFWLIIPSFEIMVHKTALKTLLKRLSALFGRKIKVSVMHPDLVNRKVRKLWQFGTM
ncbi:MAG: hypothetical protein QMD13_00375 [Candidatus Bathyarchaeia archaeon]|nr:hypothetical protein [Candidatus Bathyarchaeia archaeon]